MFRHGSYGVQTFFVISGFVIPWAMSQKQYRLKNFFVFLLKRLARLEPPYLCSILLALSVLSVRVYLAHDEIPHLDITTKGVLLHLGYLIPFFKDYHWLNGVYWTLAVEFQYYFFIALLFVPLMRMNTLFRVLFYLTCLVVSLPKLPPFLPMWLPVFLMGILLFLYKCQRIRKLEYYTVTVLLICFMLWRYYFAVALFSVVPVVCVLLWPGMKIPVLHNIGKWSYSLYLVHPLLGSALINFLSHRAETMLEKILVLLAGIAVAFIASYILYFFVERPSKNISGQIKYSRSEKIANVEGAGFS
jgi:peptidoglycan/LPS O-acetylase OafA/YrhL